MVCVCVPRCPLTVDAAIGKGGELEKHCNICTLEPVSSGAIWLVVRLLVNESRFQGCVTLFCQGAIGYKELPCIERGAAELLLKRLVMKTVWLVLDNLLKMEVHVHVQVCVRYAARSH